MTVVNLCERFGCLPSQLDAEPVRLRGGRPGLLKMLKIIALGGEDQAAAGAADMDVDGDWDGW